MKPESGVRESKSVDCDVINPEGDFVVRNFESSRTQEIP
jgi:hypothetical protein